MLLAYSEISVLFITLILAVGLVCLAIAALKPSVPENSIAGKLLLEWITLSKVASLIENEEIFSVLIINYLFVKLKTVAKVLKSCNIKD